MRKIDLYFHSTYEKNGFKQVHLLPTLIITHNSKGYFIESGVYTGLIIISISFLIWDFGIMIHK
jgi:hypothetical protein